MDCLYTVTSAGDIALSAATAKTVLSVINSANGIVRLVEISACFDGTSPTAEPVTVELCNSTEATAGTATTHTIQQSSGPARPALATAKRNFTAEPTALTVLKRWLVHPQSGLLVQFPLGREPMQTTTADALVLRCTAPAAVSFQGHMEWKEG
jgi:hypothetical protein